MINIIQNTKYQPGGNGTTVPFTLTSTPNPGNILIAFVGYSAFGGDRTITPPAGWTEIDKITSANSALATYWYEVQGGDGKTFTFNVSGASDTHSGVLYEVADADVVSPINQHSITTTGSQTTITTSSVTPSVLGTLSLSAAATDVGSNGSLIVDSVSSGHTLDQSAIPVFHSTFGVHRNDLTDDLSTAITNTFTFSQNSGGACAAMILLSEAIVAIDETVTLDDSWSILANPEILTFPETVTLDDAWSIGVFAAADYISDIIFTNPIIFVTATDPAQIVKVDITDPDNLTMETAFLIGAKNAKSVSYNSTTGFLYVGCAEGIIVKVDFTDLSVQTIIDVNDIDDLQSVSTFDDESITFASTDNSLGELHMLDERETTILDTNFQFLHQNETQINTDFEWIEALLLDTNFQFLQINDAQINTDFKWLTDTLTDIDPIGRDDFVVKIGGTTLTGDDLIPESIVVRHTIGEESEVSFRLARYHDNLNTTLNGSSIQITNQNSVEVIIKGNSAFTGNVSNLNCIFETDDEHVEVIAKGPQQVESRHTSTLSLPNNSEQLGLYNVLVQNPQINNPIIDSDDEDPEFFLGIKVNLGSKIVQSISRYQYFGNVNTLADDVTDGTFKPKQNWAYFWFGAAINFITNSAFVFLRYLGTSIGSLTGDSWEINKLSWKRQRTFDDDITELGEYTVGTAPFNEVSTKNGILISADKWTDKPDGLYREKDAGYNFEDYAKRVADLEFDKLTTINGTILPKTSASIKLTIDAYYYYALKLLTRINIDNTTESNIFKNSNGFPVSIKVIIISSGTMGVELTTDNSKSIVELEEIDDEYPDEDSSEFNFPEESVRNFTKFDPNTLTTIE